ncbi:hypothetical protein [Helicobacter pametensis]|uniref:hypothetical protein n=1 Tax=Helicobacter pametensis TaxID=95149 RepID=UPI0004BAEAF1|nr:hypothetical protein [Helicobacter pametensis]
MEQPTNQVQKKKEGGILTLILGIMSVLILLSALGGVAYYYFVLKYEGNTLDANNMQSENGHDVHKLVEQIKIKDGQIKILREENALLREKTSGMTQRLSYAIKPKAQYVTECYVAQNGRWSLPSVCLQNMKSSIEGLLASDKRIVALEVVGIVDEKPYAGRSPELKQEGLASFRAKMAIQEIYKLFPNVAVFEGLSVQEPKKRGFTVRAYYFQ